MGAWGAGLFANDLSSDLKDSFREIVRLPFSETELVEAMLDAFPSGRDADDEDYTDFWLSLADLLHGYAIESPEVFERARGIVESGADLDMKRTLDMEEADLRKRAKVLEALPEKWRTAVAKPKQRRIMKAPETFLFEPGDCVVFPTEKGNGAPAYMPAAEIARSFAPDGWGAFVVLATALRHGYWACYLVGRLYLEVPEKPTLEVCRKTVLSGIDVHVPGFPPDAAVKTVTISKSEAKKMQLESVGRFDLDHEVLRGEFTDRYDSVDDPSWSIAGLMQPYGSKLSLDRERPRKMKKLPLDRFVA